MKNKWKTTEDVARGSRVLLPRRVLLPVCLCGLYEYARACVLKLKWLPSTRTCECVCVCVIRYFSDLCHNACKSIKCDKEQEEEEEEEGGRTPAKLAKNLAQCVRLFVMGSQTHFNFICDALRTNTQTDRQRLEWGRGAAMAERINHKLMRCECRSFWQRQLSVASCQLSPVCHVFAQFASVWRGSVPFASLRF